MAHVENAPGLNLSERIYRLMLHMYPIHYRKQYGQLMMQAFRDLSRDAYVEHGFPELTKVWAHTLADVATTVVSEHADLLLNGGPGPDYSVPAVEMSNVSKGYATRTGQLRPTLVDINLTVKSGEFVAIVGPTGCGKTTLLSLIAGLAHPNYGQVSVMGQPVEDTSRHVGYIFQKDALFPWRTVLNNVLVGPIFRGVAPEEALFYAHEWINRVGLAGFEHYYPHQLSGGMRKRVALAQSLIIEPAVLLMDEPFSDLDVQTRALMEEDLLKLCASTRVSVVYVTHDIEEAITLANSIVVMTTGPARIKKIYSVDIPRPAKATDIRFHTRFGELYRQIRDDLRSEVLKTYDYHYI
jgi:NitT/TauT family transport system ATP-binding protein